MSSAKVPAASTCSEFLSTRQSDFKSTSYGSINGLRMYLQSCPPEHLSNQLYPRQSTKRGLTYCWLTLVTGGTVRSSHTETSRGWVPASSSKIGILSKYGPEYNGSTQKPILGKVLCQVGYCFPSSFISEHIPDLLQCIQTSLSNTSNLQQRTRLPSLPIPETPLPPPALLRLKTTVQVEASMRIAQDQLEREQQVAVQKAKVEKERERNKTKGLLKINENQERKRTAHKEQEMKKEALTDKYECEKKREARKQKEIEKQTLRDITNESQRRSGQNDKL